MTSWFEERPRMTALAWLLGGSLVAAAVILIGGMDAGGRAGGKATFLVGIAGIGAGVGATQLLWPPRRAQADDDRGAVGRAPWLQKILWVLGGIAGMVAAAVFQTVASGKY